MDELTVRKALATDSADYTDFVFEPIDVVRFLLDSTRGRRFEQESI